MARSKLIPFTFEGTGIQVLVRKVSPLLINDAREAFVREFGPKAPRQKVNYGTPDEPNWGEEENPTDPDYVERLKAFDNEIEAHLRRFIMMRGVVVEMGADELAEVAEVRREIKDTFGVDLDKDDKFVYVNHVCPGTQEDIEELMMAIIRRSQPTEDQIARAVDSFQS